MPEPKNMPKQAIPLGVGLLLVLAILFVYGQVRHHDFVNYDDQKYVYENPGLREGLTARTIARAFTTPYFYNWHPLTTLSYHLDYELYGLGPAGYHLTNLLLHTAAALLLFFLLSRMTGSLWPSALVAALFALHPLHVESVAWVSERKDVLCAFFWMLTLLLYHAYAQRPNCARYLLLLLVFTAGLLAKPMMVTLPCVLLLLDYWPLGRDQEDGPTGSPAVHPKWLLLEKVPLFALSALSATVTFLIQGQAGKVETLKAIPLHERLQNAVVTYLAYLEQALWPRNLAAFYPHPGGTLPLLHVLIALVILMGITLLGILLIRRAPYLAVGWLWYLGTLVPVIGFIQVGEQAMADRYTYLPLIGVFLMLAFALAGLARRRPRLGAALAVAACAALAALALTARAQARHWRNSEALWTHAAQVTTNNAYAHNNLGAALADGQRTQEAMAQFTEALRIDPTHERAHNNLGVVFRTLGKTDQAIEEYKKALHYKPDYPQARNNLGVALIDKKKIREATAQFAKAIRSDPLYAEPHFNLGAALLALGEFRQAARQFEEFIHLVPDNPDAHVHLGKALTELGEIDQAAQHFQAALRIDPDNPRARRALETLP